MYLEGSAVLVISLVLASAVSFSLFPTPEPTPLPDAEIPSLSTRGIVGDDMGKRYIAETFICDEGHRSLARDQVNDQFCDCEDGSDEPGTSACAGGRFLCRNKGYRAIEIYSSRVDDGICDCCDGSDEGFITKCPDTCEFVGRVEREAMAAKRAAYEAGSKMRTAYITEVKTSTVAKLERHEAIKPEKDMVDAELGTLRDSIARLEENVQTTKERLLRESREANTGPLFAAVGLDTLSTDRLAEVVAAFLTVTKPSVANVLQALDPNGDDEDKYDILYGDDEGEGAGEGEKGTEDGVETDRSQCVLGSVASFVKGDVLDLVDEICKHVPTNATDVPNFFRWFLIELADLIEDESAFTKLHGLAAHPQGPLHGDSIHVASSVSKISPPAHLNAQQCSAHDDVASMLRGTKSASRAPGLATSGLGEKEERLRLLKDEARIRGDKQKELASEMESIEKVGKHFQDNLDYLEFVHLQNQDECFTVKGGEYTYTVCIMGSISQVDRGGSSVNLGHFKSFDTRSDGTVLAEYHNGAHCHAHGARRATVFITCAAENRVIVVDEPSTCYYTLEMESPAACNPTFGKLL